MAFYFADSLKSYVKGCFHEACSSAEKACLNLAEVSKLQEMQEYGKFKGWYSNELIVNIGQACEWMSLYKDMLKCLSEVEWGTHEVFGEYHFKEHLKTVYRDDLGVK